MNNNIINREAADKTKGFRLQKLRAIKLILEELENSDSIFFYTAIENVEDISHTKIGQCDSNPDSTYYEEDKNYNSASSFTIFSPEVKNTLVSFFDIYIGAWQGSDDISLGFYTTASIGKERKEFSINGESKSPPEEKILELLLNKKTLTDDCIKMIKSVVVEEYKRQYSSEGKKGHIKTLEEQDIEGFREFLKKITWHFGEENEEALKTTNLERIKTSKLYNIRHQDKEEVILSLLMEELDSRQNHKNLSQKVLTADRVELIFKQAESEERSLVMDPAWQELRKLESGITDKRNLEEKIISICPNFDQNKMKRLARKACIAKTEQLLNNKSFLSLKYRIFEACSDILSSNNVQLNTEDQIESIIKNLQRESNNQIQELKKDYSYSVSNKVTVNEVVIDLIDSCFLAFDEVGNDK